MYVPNVKLRESKPVTRFHKCHMAKTSKLHYPVHVICFITDLDNHKEIIEKSVYSPNFEVRRLHFLVNPKGIRIYDKKDNYK